MSEEKIEVPEQVMAAILAEEATGSSAVKEETSELPDLPDLSEESEQVPEAVAVEEMIIEEKAEPIVKADTESKDPEDVIPARPVQNVEVVGEWSKPLPGGKLDPTKEQLPLPSDFFNRLSFVINELDNKDSMLYKSLTRGDGQWIEDMAEGFGRVSIDDGYVETTTRKGSEFTNRLDPEGRGLRAGYPSFSKAQGAKPQGDDAVRALSKIMGKGPGMPFTIPLWHTGIWITVMAPDELDILELHRILTMDLRDIGNNTYGYVFSNYKTFTTERLVDFVLKHLHSTSLNTNKDLKTIISLHDVESMIWGIACAIYPNGFQYTRSCTANPEECKEIAEGLLNLNLLSVIDKNALTQTQKDHMRKIRKGSMTIEDVRHYQSQHTVTTTKVLSLIKEEDENVLEVTLKVPTIAQHIEAGQRWISEISEIISVATEDSLDEDARRNYMINGSKATIMRQYTHMVSQMRFGDNVYNAEGDDEEARADRATIEKTLSSLSSDDDVMRKFIEEVVKFNSNTAISIIGIPTYDCSKCGGVNKTPATGAFTNLIPLDMFQTFFGLLVLKVQKVRIR